MQRSLVLVSIVSVLAAGGLGVGGCSRRASAGAVSEAPTGGGTTVVATTSGVSPPVGAPPPHDQPMPERSVGTDVAPALGVTVAALIDARADVFSSGAAVADGERGGVLPTRVTLPAGAARVVISHGSGSVGCGTGEEPTSPAGGACAGGHTDIESAGSISGIVDATRTQFLVGVFVGTPLGAAPARLDVAPGQAGEAQSLAPALGQTFYVGDGGGRAFAVPAGSVALYLGVADAWGFQGPPSYYADNTGGFRVELRAE